MKTKIHRREFVRQSTTAGLGAVALFGRSPKAIADNAEYVLKSEAQFKREAAQYQSAVREIGRVAQLKIDGGNLSETTAIIEKAAPALKYQLSSFVTMCLADSTLVNAVRKKIPNRAAVDSLIEAGAQDFHIFLQLDGVKDLQSRMREAAAEHREVVQRASDYLLKASESADSLQEAKRAEKEEECAKVWAIVVAVVLVIIAVVTAVFSSGASQSPSSVVAAPLIRRYGPNLSDVLIERGQGIADTRYTECVAVANKLPPKERARAIAECQARWLNQKVRWLISG